MGVRVRVKLENLIRKNKVVITSALVNSGYEARHPEICLPKTLAEKLGYYPLPEKAVPVSVRTSGGIVREVFVPGAIKVTLLSNEGNELGSVVADVSISEFENEVLISDALASALKIAVEDFFLGLWRLKDEKKIRHSAPPEYW